MVRIILGFEFDEDNFMGRGRIELLEQINHHGSISKAAKAMNMSYKRAWYLMQGFSACFKDPLIVRQHGGKGGGSASLTPFGQEVVRRYRSMEETARTAFASDLAALTRMIAKGALAGNKKARKASAR